MNGNEWGGMGMTVSGVLYNPKQNLDDNGRDIVIFRF